MKNHTNPSQTTKILNYLLKGKAITPLEALSRFKCFRLASRINEIKRSGVRINTEMVTKNGKRYARYSIAKKIKAVASVLLFSCGLVNAQEVINYSGYSYNTGYGNDSQRYNYGTAVVSNPNKTSQETQAIVTMTLAERYGKILYDHWNSPTERERMLKYFPPMSESHENDIDTFFYDLKKKDYVLIQRLRERINSSFKKLSDTVE
jgi:hypothetical protein